MLVADTKLQLHILDSDFIVAFEHTMAFEVGPHFDSTDPETYEGLCETSTQRHKVGFVNHPDDPGGVTKFGISQRFNPEISVISLTLSEAQSFYWQHYWVEGECMSLPGPLNQIFFDCLVHHGKRGATRLIQKAVGAKPDGILGPKTRTRISTCCTSNKQEVCQTVLQERLRLMVRLVEKRPSLGAFYQGWSARVKLLANQFSIPIKSL